MPKTVRALLASCAVITVASAATAGPASATKAPQPEISVSPNTGLTNGEAVTVTGSNFLPGTQVYITECSKSVKGKVGLNGTPYCNIHDIVPEVVTSSGTLPSGATYTVFTGLVNVPGTTCGTGKKDKICYIGVGDSLGRSNNDALGKITFVVNQAPKITGKSKENASVGDPFSVTIKTKGSPTPKSITETGSLPNGVNFTNNGNGMASLAGTPGVGSAGTYPLTITASNGIGNPASKTFTLDVKN